MVTRKNKLDSQTIQRKLRIASDLFEMAVKIKSHQLRKKFPEASEKEIRDRVIELIDRGSK